MWQIDLWDVNGVHYEAVTTVNRLWLGIKVVFVFGKYPTLQVGPDEYVDIEFVELKKVSE